MEFELSRIGNAAEMIIKRAAGEARRPYGATVVTFSGDLGAGKTTLIKEIARKLGVVDDLASPTFVIYKKYNIPHPQPLSWKERGAEHEWKYLIHGDMYRLESADDILKLGWEELLANHENLILVEWPEKIGTAVPPAAIKVVLEHRDGDNRLLDIQG